MSSGSGIPTSVVPIAIGLGTNVGDRLGHLQSAIDQLQDVLRLSAVSSIYETEPMYVEDQPLFWNAAVIGNAFHAPISLLRTLKAIESRIGRTAGDRYGPREIDLDLLAYGALSLASSADERLRLAVPHPRTPERRFVLQPLAEIAPDWELPGLGRVRMLVQGTDSQQGTVVKVTHAALSLHRNVSRR